MSGTNGDGPTADSFPLEGVDHIEMWVGNARQAAYYYEHAYGFTPIAYRGPETGIRDRASYVLAQGSVRLVLTTALVPDHEITRHQGLHGDGVRDIALLVPDARAAWTSATASGAKSVLEPTVEQDDNGEVVRAAIATYGDTVHSLIERTNYTGAFLPGYDALEAPREDERSGVGIVAVDHCVGNVEHMEEWVGFYARVMGFTEMLHFTDDDINTEYSALMSKVIQAGQGRVKFPINEPATGKRKSQIEEYLEFYRSAGVQHIALETDDIVKTVDEMHARGVEFMRTPQSYWDDAIKRIGTIDESWDDLRRTGVLVDNDDEGYLLQIFTRNTQDRPTVFFEIIQRKGARGFGDGNFKALFEAIEREQALRGNL